MRSHTRGGGNPLKGLDPRHTTASGSNHRTPSSQPTYLRRLVPAARGEITHPSREESPQGTRPPARDRKRVRSSDSLLAADTLDHGTAGAPPHKREAQRGIMPREPIMGSRRTGNHHGSRARGESYAQRPRETRHGSRPGPRERRAPPVMDNCTPLPYLLTHCSNPSSHATWP